MSLYKSNTHGRYSAARAPLKSKNELRRFFAHAVAAHDNAKEAGEISSMVGSCSSQANGLSPPELTS